MSDLSKLFIVSKNGNLDELELWKRIVKISGERFEETLEVVSEGRQNTPISSNYMHYRHARFVAFVPHNNRSHYINALVTFQTNKLPEGEADLMCGISVKNNCFAEGLLFQIALDLVEDYDLYFTGDLDVRPIKPVEAEQIKHRLIRLDIKYDLKT